MFTKARNYVIQNALPAYREFFAALRHNRFGEGEIVRLGVTAAIALYHLREHLPDPIRPTRDALQNTCPDFALVGDVANASKHKKLDRGRPRISNADQVYEMAVSTQYQDKKGWYPAVQVAVHVRLDDGTERDLADLLHGVMNMWSQKLADLEVVNIANPEALLRDRHVSRAEAAKRTFSGRIVIGEERHHRWALRRFNYQTGKPEPMDLTGAKIEMRMWKAIESIPMHVQLPELQLEADVEIPVTPAQGAKFMQLSTDEDKNRFLTALLKRSPKLQLRVKEALQKVINETGWVRPTSRNGK